MTTVEEHRWTLRREIRHMTERRDQVRDAVAGARLELAIHRVWAVRGDGETKESHSLPPDLATLAIEELSDRILARVVELAEQQRAETVRVARDEAREILAELEERG